MLGAGEANYPLTQTRRKGASIQPGRKFLSSTWWIYQLLITFDANYLGTWGKNNKWLVLCSCRKLAGEGKAGIANFLKESVISGFVTSLETVCLYSCTEKMYNFAGWCWCFYMWHNVTFTFLLKQCCLPGQKIFWPYMYFTLFNLTFVGFPSN